MKTRPDSTETQKSLLLNAVQNSFAYLSFLVGITFVFFGQKSFSEGRAEQVLVEIDANYAQLVDIASFLQKIRQSLSDPKFQKKLSVQEINDLIESANKSSKHFQIMSQLLESHVQKARKIPRLKSQAQKLRNAKQNFDRTTAASFFENYRKVMEVLNGPLRDQKLAESAATTPNHELQSYHKMLKEIFDRNGLPYDYIVDPKTDKIVGYRLIDAFGNSQTLFFSDQKIKKKALSSSFLSLAGGENKAVSKNRRRASSKKISSSEARSVASTPAPKKISETTPGRLAVDGGGSIGGAGSRGQRRINNYQPDRLNYIIDRRERVEDRASCNEISPREKKLFDDEKSDSNVLAEFKKDIQTIHEISLVEARKPRTKPRDNFVKLRAHFNDSFLSDFWGAKADQIIVQNRDIKDMRSNQRLREALKTRMIHRYITEIKSIEQKHLEVAQSPSYAASIGKLMEKQKTPKIKITDARFIPISMDENCPARSVNEPSAGSCDIQIKVQLNDGISCLDERLKDSDEGTVVYRLRKYGDGWKIIDFKHLGESNGDTKNVAKKDDLESDFLSMSFTDEASQVLSGNFQDYRGAIRQVISETSPIARDFVENYVHSQGDFERQQRYLSSYKNNARDSK